ncbi:phosphotransferase [Rhodovibrio salinarum]|uniref:Aminoglycoside phosphotransferase domain-containing protein n=1 Tax=Rhodovibrio salinarum TaxID=1087 RepID=A0A934QIR4_9PROT|nr:phosphotransferase [Rhodovibrio salinarum]MBK1697457.1 hypothetical protein [Rhodovibrio salinarum]
MNGVDGHGKERNGGSVGARDPSGSDRILTALASWTPGPERRFVRQGPWLVRRGLIARLALGPFVSRSIPGLAAERAPRLVAGALSGHGVDLRIEADALQVAASGGRVRTFDLSAATSSKLVVRDSRYGAGTERELHVRQSILPGTGVGFPPVHWSSADDTYIFLVEDLIHGRRFTPRRDARLIASGLVEPLMQLAEAQETRRVPLTEALGVKVAAAIAGDARPDPILERARALVQANPSVVTIFGHGDLLPSNIAVSRTGLVLLDWETAGEMLVGYDLLRLWLKYPRIKALQTGARKMVARFQTSDLSLADTVALRLAQVLAGTERNVRPVARQSWQAMD